jgi:hypothetical protein
MAQDIAQISAGTKARATASAESGARIRFTAASRLVCLCRTSNRLEVFR